jgi:hypothetical protein
MKELVTFGLVGTWKDVVGDRNEPAELTRRVETVPTVVPAALQATM